ncbi:hypothetical protein tinsulaeT_08420 [Thalassotalea insulae]|uniref:Auto-transporter adhesin head GIN domain-containing protein n=1 Tax=Thalassotalea insulae TaxID=2056778 RepID=A0ABQ6GNJ1_9GAMM|nr:hypothetical protein [Thalassotalea insulae]GLX77502.1 hypothetical protein tinsulaeT_08420 [Thalassotalea insulae]
MAFSRLFFTLAFTSILSGCIVVTVPSASARLSHHQQQKLSLDSESLTSLQINAGAGSLLVVGVEEAKTIRVIADVYSSQPDYDNVELALTGTGGLTIVEAGSGGLTIKNVNGALNIDD